MKTLISLALILTSFAAQASEEQPISCLSTQVNDAGFYLVVAPDQKTAKLQAESFAGPRPLADLTCVEAPAPIVNAPDMPQEFLVCTGGDDVRGYEVRLSAGGLWFHIFGNVYETSNFDGAVTKRLAQYGHVECSQER